MSKCAADTKALMKIIERAKTSHGDLVRFGYLTATIDFAGLVANDQVAAGKKDFFSKGHGQAGSELGISGNLSFADTTFEGKDSTMPAEQSFVMQGLGVILEPSMGKDAARELAQSCYLTLEVGGERFQFGSIELWPAAEFGVDANMAFGVAIPSDGTVVDYVSDQARNGKAGMTYFDPDNYIGFAAQHTVKFYLGWDKTLSLTDFDGATLDSARVKLVMPGTFVSGKFNV